MKKIICCFVLVFVLLINNVNAYAANEFSHDITVSAAAATLLNADTGEVIYNTNGRKKLPMASTTKIMTALILAEQPDLSKTVITTKEMVTVEGSSMGLLPGDTVTYHDLLYGMLLASGNDAANVTAISLAGSKEKFVAVMNSKAKKIGMTDTNFVTPSGLDDKNHFSTSNDMAKLAAYALKNENFKAACSSKEARLNYGNPPYRRTLTNHNKLLFYYDDVIGVKTGFTKKSGRCLVSAGVKDGRTIIAVTLNDKNDWDDHRKLLDYGYSKTKTVTFENTDICDTVSVISGDCDLARLSVPKVSFGILSGSEGKIKRVIKLPKFIYSPAKSGTKIGEINYYINYSKVYSADILVAADVGIKNEKEKFLKRFINSLKLLIRFT